MNELLCQQAMAIVQERLNANKPPPPQADPKTGKLAPGQINNNKDLDVESRKDEPSFFGSFFSKSSAQQKKKGVAVMESVGSQGSTDHTSPATDAALVKPPPVIRPQAALSERETMETEVISERRSTFSQFLMLKPTRTPHTFLLQYRQARNDRHGSHSHHTHPRCLLEGESATRASARTVQAGSA